MAFGRYCLAAREEADLEEAYRAYMADCLRMVTESTANFARGRYMKARWVDLLNPQKEETRTAEEVIAHMRKVLGGSEVKPDGPI